MKSFMQLALVGLLAISSAAYAGNGKHVKVTKAKQDCPAGCTKNTCKKNCPDQKDCTQMGCRHK
jgi:hypothetical protein